MSTTGRRSTQIGYSRGTYRPTSRRVTGCRTAAIQRVASCVLRMPPGSQQGALGAIRTLLPRPTWLDVLVRIVRLEPGQAERMRPRIAEPDRRVPGELVSAVGHGEIDT